MRPITFNWGLTTNVARPYAKLLATQGKCDHFLAGDPGDRMRRAGYHPSWWGENIGCRDGSNVYTSILASHRAFQAEKPSNGGHWRNIKNSQFQFVGLGIYRYGSHIRLVVDFYRTALTAQGPGLQALDPFRREPRAVAGRRDAAQLEEADGAPALAAVGLQQLEHPLVGAARLAGQRPAHEVLEVEVAHAHRVGDRRTLAADLRGRPRTDARDGTEQPVGGRRVA